MTATTAVGCFVSAAGTFFRSSRALRCHPSRITAIALFLGCVAIAAIVPHLSVVDFAIAAVRLAPVAFSAEQLDVGNL